MGLVIAAQVLDLFDHQPSTVSLWVHALLIAGAAALIIYTLIRRPPHDREGD